MLNRTAGMASLVLQRLGFLPSEVLVGEVAILCGLAVDGIGQVELLYDDTWPEVEVRPNDIDQFFRRLI